MIQFPSIKAVALSLPSIAIFAMLMCSIHEIGAGALLDDDAPEVDEDDATALPPCALDYGKASSKLWYP